MGISRMFVPSWSAYSSAGDIDSRWHTSHPAAGLQALRALASLGRVKSKALGPLCQAIAHQEEVPAKHVCKMLHAFQTLTVPSAALPPAIQVSAIHTFHAACF